MAPGCSSASTGSRLLKIDPKAARTEYGPIYADHELAGSRRRRRGGRCRAEEIRPCACRRLSTQFHWFASSDRRQRNPGSWRRSRQECGFFPHRRRPASGQLGAARCHDDDITVGCGCDRLRGFGAFSAIFRSLARAFALYPAKDFFRNLVWQIGRGGFSHRRRRCRGCCLPGSPARGS